MIIIIRSVRTVLRLTRSVSVSRIVFIAIVSGFRLCSEQKKNHQNKLCFPIGIPSTERQFLDAINENYYRGIREVRREKNDDDDDHKPIIITAIECGKRADINSRFLNATCVVFLYRKKHNNNNK